MASSNLSSFTVKTFHHLEDVIDFAPNKKNILFVRHAPREGGKIVGREAKLTKEGEEEAKRLSRKLRDSTKTTPMKRTHFVSSEIPRCVQTCRLLMDAFEEKEVLDVKILEEVSYSAIYKNKSVFQKTLEKEGFMALQRHSRGEMVDGLISRDEYVKQLSFKFSSLFEKEEEKKDCLTVCVSHDHNIACFLEYYKVNLTWPLPLCGALISF